MSAQAGASYDIAGLTNNMPIGHGSAMARTLELAAQIAEVMALFAHVIESWKIGARKPEPRFYARACGVVGVPPPSSACSSTISASTSSRFARWA